MNKFLTSALILLTLAFSAKSAIAQELSADFVKSEVVAAVKRDLTAQGFSDIDVKVISVPFSKLELPDGRFSMQVVQIEGAGYSKRCIKPLRVYVGGRLIRSFGVPLDVTAYKPALVAAREIGMGQSINAANVVLKKVEVDGNHHNLVGTNWLSNDLVAAKLYRPGQPIDKRFAKVRADVQKDDIVTVIFNSTSDLSVSVKGKAMQTGSKGDMVAVKNSDNKKVYYGEIVDRNLVKVNI